MKIPLYQAIPPAGFESLIAFRPACRQVQSRLVAGKTEHFLTMPSGEEIILTTLPPMPSEQACKTLTDWGLAKSGVDAVDVPIMTPTSALAMQPEIIPIVAASSQNSVPISSYLPWAIGLAVVTIKAVSMLREHQQWSKYE